MNFIDKVIEKAKTNIKTIVLPESEDIRVLEAAEKITKAGFAKIVLIGDINSFIAEDKYPGIDFSGVTFVDPKNCPKTQEYINTLYELRKAKGMTIEQAEDLILNNSRYFASMMVKMGDADGFVSGACHPTADTLKPTLQIIKGREGVKTVSAFFIMDMQS